MLQKTRQYKSKCVGFDGVKLDSEETFEVVLVLRDVPKKDLEFWREKLFRDVIIDVDAS